MKHMENAKMKNTSNYQNNSGFEMSTIFKTIICMQIISEYRSPFQTF